MRALASGAICLLLTALPAPAGAQAPLSSGITDLALAEHYAPAIYQDVADGLFDDEQNFRRDFLTRIDFDGDLDATNNLESLQSGAWPLRAFVYYDVVETETHYFIAYSFFHPDDWNPFGGSDHENDMENQRVVVEKDGSAFGRFLLTDFNAHGAHLAYSDRPDVAPGTLDAPGRFRAAGVEFEDDAGLVSDSFSPAFSHVRVYIEPQGHGPTSCAETGTPFGFTNGVECQAVGGTDKVVYRLAPGSDPGLAGEPDPGLIEHGVAHQVVPYVLLRSLDELWPHRQEIEGDPGAVPLWDQPFAYRPGRNTDGDPSNNFALRPPGALRLGAEFAGDEGGGQGRPAWGFESDASGVPRRGDWVLDPAYATAVFYEIPGEDAPGYCHYLFHPALEDLVAGALSADCGQIDESRSGCEDAGGGAPAFAALLAIALYRRPRRPLGLS